jgi:SAM-dependent methyltransferase
VRILNSLGPMARDLDDLELALRLIAGPDGVDTDVPPVPLAARRQRDLPSLRLAWAPALPDTTVAQGLREQVARVAATAADAGATVVAHLPELDWRDQWVFGELMAVTEVFAPGAAPKTLDWYFDALARRDRWIAAWERFFDDYDALLLPPASSTAFHHDATGTDQQGLQCVFANLAGLPALTVPAGHDEHGLPVGIQIVGPRWAEIRLLDVAAALEAAAVLPGFTAPPAFGPVDPDPSAAVALNRRTVAAYEEYAPTYAKSTAPGPSGPSDRDGLRRLADLVGPGGTVLEIGSGPGWDADYLETLGAAVRRTDVTAKFVELQADRGRKATLVDVISDPLGGPYDGVVALCVLLHIERDVTDSVLRKVSGALRPGGGFLVSIREGSGEHWEGSTGAYRAVLWQHDEFVGRLAAAGLAVDWTTRHVGSEGPWLTFLATRRSPAP